MRRWLDWRYGLLLPLLTLLTSSSWAQIIPDWVKEPGVDENGNKIYYYQDFEDKGNPSNNPPTPPLWHDKPEAEYILNWEKKENVKPRDWVDNRFWKDYHLSSNNVFISWQVKAQGGDGLPYKSANGRLHLRYYALDDEAFSAVILPKVKLNAIEEPKLRFKFASPSRTNVDKLVILCRLYQNAPWIRLDSLQEQVEEFEWREFDLKGIKAKAMANPISKGEVVIALEGHTLLGGGLNIDDLMIVDVAGKPSTIGRTEFVQLDNPVGSGTKLNELARFFFEVKSGSGHFKLKELNLQFQGDNINDAQEYYLYHTATPYFSPDPENLYGELKIEGGKFKLPEHPTEKLEKLYTGPHYFWIVADIKDGSDVLKHTMTFKLPSEEGKAVLLKYYDITNQPKAAADAKLPRKGDSYPYSETTHATIYKCLFQDDFEGPNVSTDWELASNVWHVGTPLNDQSLTIHRTAPTRAFSGTKVLATAKLKNGSLDGNYENGLHASNSRALYKKEAGIVADFYKDIRFKAKYCLNSKPDDKFRLVLITDKTANNTQQDIETVVWESSTRSVMSGWSMLNVDLSRVASRCKKFRFRFELETDNEDNQSGLFLDDIQILGEYIQNDLGIISLEVPKGFDMGSNSSVKVKIKNFGEQSVDGSFDLKVNLNGKETTQQFALATPLVKGAEHEVTITGLDLTPQKDLSNQKLLSVTVVLPSGKKDDDPSNDREEVRFYVHPTYEVSETTAYPEDKYARLLHWYPEAKNVLYQSSWVEADIDQQEKFNTRTPTNQLTPKPAYVNPPYSHTVWTTGTPFCYQSEHSYLTGPIFDLKGAENKEFIIAYAYEKDASNTPAMFWIEYRKEGASEQWQKLGKGTDWFSNWYENAGEWKLTEPTNGFKVAKTQLPIQTGKIQFRVVFEAGVPTAGVTISGFEVRPMRADLQVTKFVPDNTNPCNGYQAQNLKITVRNNGPETLKQPFSCPATVRVYEYKNNRMYGQSTIDVTNTNNFELRGEHNITLEFNADLAKNAEKEFDTGISYPWDVSDWGYRVVVTLYPENKGKPDEEATNNTTAKDIVSLKPTFQIVKDLAPAVSGNFVYYTEALPKVIQTIMSKDQHFSVGTITWTPSNGAAGTVVEDNKSYNITQKGKLKLDYTLTSSYPYSPSVTCPQSLEFEVKTTTANLKVTGVKFTDQEEPTADYGCYYASGEPVEVTVQSMGSKVDAATIKLFVNGTELSGLSITPVPLDHLKTHTFMVSGVKIPKGYSQFEVLATASSGENVSSYQNRYHADRLFRSVKEKPKVYWMKRNIPASLEAVADNHVVNNYVGQIDLYVAPVKGAKYEWYRGNTGASIFAALTKIEGATSNTFALPEESAVYAVKVIHGKCGGDTSDLIIVRSDDIELLNFTGITGGVCASGGELPLSVDIRNNSRTTYPVGTLFSFEIKVESGGTTLHTHTFDYQLPIEIPQSSVTNHLLFRLTGNQFNPSGDNTITLEFKGEKKNGQLILDGNTENNKLTSLLTVRESPTITLTPDVIRRKFNPAGTYTISPTYSNDVTEYSWEAWNDEHGKYQVIGGSNNSSYQVNGVPQDKYRVTAKNSSGCSTQKEVTIIQTDLHLTEIVSPRSACEIKKELGDYVDLKVRNTGSKGFKDLENQNVKLKVTVTLDGASRTVDFDLPRELYTVDAEVQLPRIEFPNLVSTLTSTPVRPHTLTVSFNVLHAEDIDDSNNKKEVTIQEFGTPKFTMVYNKKSASGTTTPTTITDGEVVEYYNTEPTEFKFEQVSVANVSYIWEFGKDNLFSSKSRILNGIDENGDGIDDEDLSTEVSALAHNTATLYNKYTKKYSTDGLGSGFYYMQLKTIEGCSATQGFELKVLSVDLAVESIEAPKSACEYIYDHGTYRDYPQVKVNVKNAGTKDIPRNTELEIKCMVYKERLMNLGTEVKTLVPIDDNGNKITYKLDRDLRKGDAVTVSLPFDINSVSGHDGMSFYFKAEVGFVSNDFKEREFVKENNNIAYNELDETKKAFMMEDYRDVNITTINVRDLDPATVNNTLGKGDTYKYEYLYPSTGGQPNKVTLSANAALYPESKYKYQWGLSYGLQIKNDPDATDPNKDFTKFNNLVVDGSGYFTLALVSDQGCKGEFRASLSLSGGDIIISEVVAPASKACFDGIAGTPISFKIMNSQEINLTSDQIANHGAEIAVSYQLMKKGTPTNLLEVKPLTVSYDGYNDAAWKHGGTLIIPDNSEMLVTLPVTMPAIAERGEYILKVTITPSAALSLLDKNIANNTRDHQIELIGAPEVDASKLTGGNFYTASTTLTLDQNAYTSYRNFSWTRPDGSQTTVNETSSVLEDVDKPGKYTLTFHDQYGCVGTQSTTVRFPGYLMLVPNPVTAPKDGCSITGTSQDLTFVVQNAGKEDYEIPTQGIPVEVKLWDPDAYDKNTGNLIGEPTEWKPLLVTSESKKIAPTETRELSTAGLPAKIDLPRESAVFRKWYLKLQLANLAGDESFNPGKVERHPAESEVFDKPKPKSPNLEDQAIKALEKLNLLPPSITTPEGKKAFLKEIPLMMTKDGNTVKTTFVLDANGFTENETYKWELPEGYEQTDKDDEKRELTFKKTGLYKVKIVSGNGCETESEAVKLRYKVEYTITPVVMGEDVTFCVNKADAKTPYTVHVKVSVDKADELIPTGTVFTFKYLVEDEHGVALGSEVVETKELTESLSKGSSFEYTFTAQAQMPKGKSVIKLSTTFNDGEEDYSGVGSKELRYVENPVITMNPEYKATTSPVVLTPIVEGGEKPYTYNWNGVAGEGSYSSEGGTVKLLVTDKNNCQAEAMTVVQISYKLTLAKSGEGRVEIQHYDEAGNVLENELLRDGDALLQGRKLRINIIPDVARSYYLEYLTVNEEKIDVDRKGKEYIIPKITGNVAVEVGFKKTDENKPDNPSGIEEELLSQVLCVSPVRENLILLHTQGVARYEVLNSLGVSVLSGLNVEGSERIMTSAQSLHTGVYLVRLYANNGVAHTLRIVKE